MTVVLLTALWPERPDGAREEGTFAVYELVRRWTLTDDLYVFRLKRTPWWGSGWAPSRAEDFEGCRVVPTPLGPELWGRSWVAPTVGWVKTWLTGHGIAPDVIVTHFRSSHLIGERLCRLFPKAVHVAGIHQFDLGRLAKRPSFRKALDRADGVAFRSPSLMERARSWGHWEDKSFLALSGVPEEWLSAARPPGRPPAPLRVGTVGRLIERKYVDHVLRALASLDHVSWSLDIVGDGPCRAALETLTDELGVRSNVCFTGSLTHQEVKSRLDGWDVFAMPSTRETFGLAYLEALARGCVIIGGRGWGVDGIVVDGDSGFLVPPGDTPALAHLFGELQRASDDEWSRWKTAGRSLVATMTEASRSAEYRAFLEQTWKRKTS